MLCEYLVRIGIKCKIFVAMELSISVTRQQHNSKFAFKNRKWRKIVFFSSIRGLDKSLSTNWFWIPTNPNCKPE